MDFVSSTKKLRFVEENYDYFENNRYRSVKVVLPMHVYTTYYSEPSCTILFVRPRGS